MLLTNQERGKNEYAGDAVISGKLSTTLSDFAATFSAYASIIAAERHVKFKHAEVAVDLLSRATLLD